MDRPANDPSFSSASRDEEASTSLTPYPISVTDTDPPDYALKSINIAQTETVGQPSSSSHASCSHSGQQKPGKATLAGAATENTLPICWQVGNIESISNFNIMFSTVSSAGKIGKWSIFTTEDANNKCILENLTPGTPYRIRITAITDDGCSYQGDISDTFMTAKVIPPAVPTSVRLEGHANHDSMTITWDIAENPAAGQVTSYTVSWKPEDSDDWKNLDCVSKPVVLECLKPYTKYVIKVVAHSKYCSSLPGEVSELVSTSISPPGIPKLVDSSDLDHVVLGWEMEDIGPQAVSNFTVFYKDLEGGVWQSVESDGPELKTKITNLDPGTTYQFKVSANTSIGQSPASRPNTITIPLPCPGIPKAKLAPIKSQQLTYNTLTLVWDLPIGKNGKMAEITYSTIQYRDVTQETWQEQDILNNQCQGTIYGLKPETFYTARVISHSRNASSPPSEVGGPFKTPACHAQEDMFKQKLRSQSDKVASDKDMPLYQLPLKKIEANDQLQKKEFGTPNNYMVRPTEEKVILIVGATGAGKSTFINGMINFILGTDWADDFRFRLVEESGSFESQHKSQTRLVTVYRLHHQDEFKIPFSLTIIDTPGYGDTGGIKKDKEITESLHDLFKRSEYGVDHIDAVGFVAQSSLARLTPTQKYIFDSILSLFGKDIESNIFLLITFCDPQKPPVLASIKEAKIPFHSSFKFNNSALFASNTQVEDKEFNQIFWDMGVKGFQLFLNVLVGIEGKSLYLTKEVLDERHQLEAYVHGLHEDIRLGLSKLEQYEKEVQVVKNHEVDIKKNRNFTYKVKIQKMQRKDLEPGTHVTNCLHCNRTCHYPCKRADDEHKKFCVVMVEGKCKICQCSWELHKNVPYRIVWEACLVEKTVNDLKRQYERAQGKKMNAEKLLSSILDEFYESQVKVLCATNEVRKGLQRLHEIALRPNPLSMTDYLDILICAEINEAQPGWKDRVEQLHAIKDQAITIGQVAHDEGYDPFARYNELLKQATPYKKPRLKKLADEMKCKCKKTYDNARKKLHKVSAESSATASLYTDVQGLESYV